MPPPPPGDLPNLPPPVQLETVPVLKVLARAHRVLAELKGRAAVVPNPGILINTLTLQEARASSEIENIVTTQDDLFRADGFPDGIHSPATREVARCRAVLWLGYNRMRKTGGLVSNNTLIRMFRMLLDRGDGFRTTPGTTIRNVQTGEVLHTPPQDANEIVTLMTSLERFINLDEICDLDPLIKMALIHHQFESIHPFPDGNGRVGRILNLLYLTRTGLLDIPILYMSRHIIRTREDYYRLLQGVRNSNDPETAWRDWVLYMLEVVTETAGTTLEVVERLHAHMLETKHRMRKELPGVYSQDILNNLFRHPYTRIAFVMNDLNVSRPTATRYLHQLTERSFVEKRKIGNHVYYVNRKLAQLFLNVSGA